MGVLAESIAVYLRAILKGVRLVLQSEHILVMCVYIYIRHEAYSECFGCVQSRLCAVNVVGSDICSIESGPENGFFNACWPRRRCI